MPSMPRVITADPTGTIARIMRAAIDLIDRPVRIVDVPNGPEALEEMQRGGADLLISAWELDATMRGLELVLRVRQLSEKTGLIILGDLDDPDELDDETTAESPFVYMSRPVDIQQFVRVLLAGLDGEDMHHAMYAVPAGVGSVGTADMGPIPTLDVQKARAVTDGLLRDLPAMAIVLASRDGQVLLAQGATSSMNLEKMTNALLPIMSTIIQMKEMVGGQGSALQYFDGQDYDVFVLSAGLHHFMCLVFDGEIGARQFGAVNRYGRKACEDLIGIIGASAFIIAPPDIDEEEKTRKAGRKAEKRATKEVKIVAEDVTPLEKAAIFAEPVVEEPEPVRLQPIADLDESIFERLSDIDESDLGDLFDPENLAKLAQENQQDGKKLSWDEANAIGLLKS